MKFKELLAFLLILLLIDGIIAKYGGKSFSRSFSRGHSPKLSNSRSPHGSSTRTSYGASHSRSSTSVKPVSTNLSNQKPGSTSLTQKSNSHPTGSTTSDINHQFLKIERGGAIHTDQKKQVPPIQSTPISISRTPERPNVVTESKQLMPTASIPQNQNTGHSTTGQTYPAWGNPYLGTNRPSSSSASSRPPWNTAASAFNRTTSPSQSHIPHTSSPAYPQATAPHPYPTAPNPYPTAPNPYPTAPNPYSTAPNSYPTATGFKPHVYPQTYPTSAGTQFSPNMGSHPPYPSHIPSSNTHWPTPPAAPPHHSVPSVPLGNPYTMHPSSPGMYNIPSHPQPPIILAQPAAQPIVPGQPIILAGQTVPSHSSTGQIIKEALIFSTVNAAVNRIINPHSHTHYHETRPEGTPTTSTHITYNNQYFNIPPGSTNATGAIQGPSTPTGTQVGGSNTNYPSRELNSNMDGNNPSPAINGNNPPPTINGNNPSPATNGNSYTSNTFSTVPSTTSINGKPGISTNVINSTSTPTIYSDQTNSPNNPSANTISYGISENELLKISEELFAHTPQDLLRHIKLNLQTRVTSPNVTDEAKEPLFVVNPDILEYPTIYVIRSLYDKYGYDFHKKLNRTIETRKQENLLIDTFLNTDVMEIAMQWLASRGFIDPDDFERKDILRRIWFTMFSGTSCGFERVFVSENYDTAFVGVQDWIYFEYQESLKRIDYMGYVDKLDIGSSASLLKLNFALDGIVRQNATIFVGTRPELEMALYTICFYARPNDICPVSLAGTKFYIYSHSFTYFGNEIVDFGIPTF